MSRQDADHSKVMYKVLVAVADEVFGKAIVEFIKAHNWPEHTRFHLLHVIEPNPLKNRILLPDDAIADITEEEQQSGRYVLNVTARLLYSSMPGARVARHLIDGDASRQILRMASALPADMIVVGSHGRRGFDRFLLGSVANAVATRSPCSIVVVHLSAEQLKNEQLLELTAEEIAEDLEEMMACDAPVSTARVNKERVATRN